MHGHLLRRLVTTISLFIWLAVPAPAGDAQVFYKRGREMEARQDYEAAYQDYRHACSSDPKNTQYRAAVERISFLAAQAKIHRGNVLQQAGRLEEALKLFEAALEIDPSSPIAAQRVRSTRDMIQRGETSTAANGERKLNPDILDLQGPVKLGGIANVPITLKMSEDAKIVYETIGKLGGLNVLFDPDYPSRRVQIELHDVTLTEALELVSAETKTFWKAMTPNTIFVASDNPAKRKELEQNVIKTFYLSNLAAPTELQDIVNALRTILEVTRIQQLPSHQAIVIRGTPDQVLLAEKMIADLDLAAPEVLVDFALMQVSRDKMHTVGISPPTSATLQLQSNTSTSSSSSSTTTTTSSSSCGSSSSSDCINLNAFANLNATDFVATVSSASISALFSDSSTKIIQNPQLRSLNGQKATIKIGERVPTATGSYQSGVSGVAVSSLVNTQFQYIDVGVNVDITPTVHDNGDISLKLTIDVSSVTSYQNIGGISEPVIGQRKVEHQIRLKDGEVSLIGGMLEQDDTRSLTGYPGLSQIPFLKYLFSQKKTEVVDNEVVFVVIPHLVRSKDTSEFSRKLLDVGTANAIHVRHEVKPVLRLDASPRPPASKPAEMPDASPTKMKFNPAAVTVQKGSTFKVDVTLSGAQDVHTVPLRVMYDPKGLQLLNVSEGDFLSQGDQLVALVHREDPSTGTVEIASSRPPGSLGVSGNGIVSTLTFQAKTTGHFPVRIVSAAAVSSHQEATSVSGDEITISVE